MPNANTLLDSRRPLALLTLCLALASSGPGCRTGDTPSSGTTESPLATLSPAEQLLERSIRYHDPEGVWYGEVIPIAWTSSRPNGEVSFHFDIEFGPGGDFAMTGDRKGQLFEYRVAGTEVHASVDGSEELGEEVREQMVLNRDGGLFWRDYFGFLGGMPMNLKDAGVLIRPEVTRVELEGLPTLAIDVNFSEGVGTDFWTYYFDPDTARVVACRFYREDPKTDGEIILFDEESRIGSLTLPRKRRWYMNADRKFLGTDELRALTEE